MYNNDSIYSVVQSVARYFTLQKVGYFWCIFISSYPYREYKFSTSKQKIVFRKYFRLGHSHGKLTLPIFYRTNYLQHFSLNIFFLLTIDNALNLFPLLSNCLKICKIQKTVSDVTYRFPNSK